MKSVFYPILLSLFLPLAVATAQNNANTFYYTLMPVNLADGMSNPVTLLVSGASQDTLGQNGQGVCRVYLSMEHQWIGEMEIILTAPNGQSVTLAGPAGLSGLTNSTTWDVAFTPCNTQAAPDPDRPDYWTNSVDWGSAQTYTGTYYPYNGCLEQLTGPVNGIWTLTVADDHSLSAGMLTGFGIEFCDATGMSSNSCIATAGNLPQADVSFEEGSSQLDLFLLPTYTGWAPVPPPSLYDYTYVISRASDGLLLGYDAGADLRTLDTGTYTVCGLNYPKDADSLLPAPNGLLTVDQLRNALNTSTPPFCGDITSNCVNVVIQPAPIDTLIVSTICADDCLEFYGSVYCQAGIYHQPVTLGGSVYNATLNLIILPPIIKAMRDTICAGECSMVPGFENACSTGPYTTIRPNILPDLCDTTVHLTLIVLNPLAQILAPTTQLNCTTTSIVLSTPSSPSIYQRVWTDLSTGATQNTLTYTVTQPGLYAVSTSRHLGTFSCTGYDTIQITQDPNLIPLTAAGGLLGCGNSTVTLQAHVTGQNLSFNWTGPGGFTSTEQNPVTYTAGTYFVTVSNSTCSVTATAVVSDSTFVTITAAPDTLTCEQSTTLLSVHTNIPDAVFSWNSPVTSPNVQNPVIDQPGIYTVVVTSAQLLCTTTASIAIEGGTPPVITTVLLFHPTFGYHNGKIDIDVSGAPGPYTYVWKRYGNFISNAQDISNGKWGVYTCTVTSANGCQTVQSFTLINTVPPVIIYNLNVRWTVQPNPSPGQFRLRTDADVSLPVSLSVYDGSGRVVWQQEALQDAKEIEINLLDAPDGLYFLEIVDGAERLWQKVVVQR